MGLESEARSSESRFAAYVEAITSALGHADRAAPFRSYCAGLLLPGVPASPSDDNSETGIETCGFDLVIKPDPLDDVKSESSEIGTERCVLLFGSAPASSLTPNAPTSSPATEAVLPASSPYRVVAFADGDAVNDLLRTGGATGSACSSAICGRGFSELGLQGAGSGVVIPRP